MTPPSRPRLSFADDHAPERSELVEPRWTTRDGLLRIRSANSAGHWTLELNGEFDVSNAETLAEEVRVAEASGETITVDLRGLSFMDSAGVRALVDAQHRCQLDGRLHLKKGPRTVQSVFRLTGTEQALPFDG